MLGPIDYIAVGFDGNHFDGSILEALAEASESGIIRVVDLVFVIKDEAGDIVMAEVEDQEDELKQVTRLVGHKGDIPLITEDDLAKLGEKMDNNTSAGVLVIEHLWAKKLKNALMDAGGVLLDEQRIHPEKVALALEEIEMNKEAL